MKQVGAKCGVNVKCKLFVKNCVESFVKTLIRKILFKIVR